MEREGREGRGKGGEMRKGIIVGGMILSLLLGCNNGVAELEKNNKFLSSLANLGNDFLSVFTSFGDIFTGTLGFKADTKKSEVATYFKNVQSTLENTKKALNKIVDDMQAQENSNATGVETAVKTLNEKLTTIIEGAKTASGAIGEAKDLIGNVAPGGAGGGAKEGAVGDGVDNLVKGIKSIVKVVLKDNEGNAEAGDDKKNDALSTRTGGNAANDEAGKLFNGTDAGNTGQAKKSAVDAAKAVGAVTGADILQAIAKGDTGGAFKLANAQDEQGITKKDAVIAGAIALRAMANGGKFANENSTTNADVVNSVKGAAVSAVTKALDTLTIAIRKTIDEGLKSVKEAMKINPETTPVNSEGTINK